MAHETYHDRHMAMDFSFRREFDRYPAILGHKRDYIVAFDHDIANPIIEQAEIENVDSIIMGWHESSRFQYSLGEVASQVLTYSKRQILLMKGYFPGRISKILVAYNGKENAVYGLHLAKRLACQASESPLLISFPAAFVCKPDKHCLFLLMVPFPVIFL